MTESTTTAVKAAAPEVIETPVSADAAQALMDSKFPPRDEAAAELTTAEIHLAAAGYKPLSRETLIAIANVGQSAAFEFKSFVARATDPENGNVFSTLLRNDFPHHVLSEDEVDFDAVDEMTKLEQFSLCVIVNKLWHGTPGLRTTVSTVSQRPPECVFIDDPTPDELWVVDDVALLNDGAIRVDFLFAEEAKASCLIERLPNGDDGITIIDRPRDRFVCLPGQRLGDLLFSKAFDAADAAKAAAA